MTVLQGWICVHQTHKAKSNEIAYSFVASRGFLVTARFSYYRYTRNYNIAMNLNHTYRTNETQTKLSRTKKSKPKNGVQTNKLTRNAVIAMQKETGRILNDMTKFKKKIP